MSLLLVVLRVYGHVLMLLLYVYVSMHLHTAIALLSMVTLLLHAVVPVHCTTSSVTAA